MNEPIAKRLTAEQRDELMLLRIDSRKTLEECVTHCAEKFTQDTSISALARFFEVEASEWRIRRARENAREAMKMGGDEISEAEKRVLAQRAFELAMDTSTPPEIVLRLRDQTFAIADGKRKDKVIAQKDAQIAQKEKEIALATRKVEMLEAKVEEAREQKAKAEEVLANSTTGISDEVRDAVRAALGMK